jgi:hypothetical protein
MLGTDRLYVNCKNMKRKRKDTFGLTAQDGGFIYFLK